MTVTDLLQHLSEGCKVKTERGEFILDNGDVRYRGKIYTDFSSNSYLHFLLDEIGEGVWAEEPEPNVIVHWLQPEWNSHKCFHDYMSREFKVFAKPEHVEAFEKHVESFKGEA